MVEGPPLPILAALSRLNEHARAGGFGKAAIYAYKQLAALMAAQAGAATVRAVSSTVMCRNCKGTKLHTWWDTGATEPCRTCRHVGYVTLRFAETSICDGAALWHHPWDTGGGEIARLAWGVDQTTYPDHGDALLHLRDGTEQRLIWHVATGWGPNLPAERLPARVAIDLLNEVEAWLMECRFGPDIRWRHDQALRAVPSYQIHLPRMDTECWRCGSPEKIAPVWLGRSDGFLYYSRPACRECSELDPITGKHVWPTRPPSGAITPAVETWLAHPWRRHGYKPLETYRDY